MNLDQLRVVETVAKAGGLAKASSLLGKTQSTLSFAIRSLEQDLKVKIFDRSSYRLKITEAGKMILEDAQATLRAADKLRRTSIEISEKRFESELFVAVDPTVGGDILKQVVTNCFNISATTRLYIKHCLLSACTDELLAETADLAFSLSRFSTKDIEYFPLYQAKLVTAVSKKVFKANQSDENKIMEILPQALLYNPGDFRDERHGLRGTELHEIKNQCIYLASQSLKLQIIEAGLAWGRVLTTELTATKPRTLVELKTPPQSTIDLEVCLMRKRNRPLGPVGQHVWNYFRNKNYRARLA